MSSILRVLYPLSVLIVLPCTGSLIHSTFHVATLIAVEMPFKDASTKDIPGHMGVGVVEKNLELPP